MPEQKKQKKDVWDILDVLGKLISTVLLALIVIYLNRGAEKISSSLKTGTLVQSLINDLTTKDIKARRDLALIALHRSEGPSQTLLVADIAERMVLEDPGEKDIWGSIPFTILDSRDHNRAEKLRKAIEKSAVATVSKPETRPISPTDPSKPLTTGPKQISIEATKLSRVGANVVYIQFNGEEHRHLADKLKILLKENKYVVPKVEKVDSNYNNKIRYFNADDYENAHNLSSLVNNFLEKNEKNQKIEPEDFSTRFKAPRGQLEVWLNLNK